MDCVVVEGWVIIDVVKELFLKVGLDFDIMKVNVVKGVYYVDMGDLIVSVEVNNMIKKLILYNFIVILLGSEKLDEYIIYFVYWDYFGIDKICKGD